MPHHTPRAGRECREHERLWRGYCVDRNLEDGWLEALNALEALNLISICEGHVTGRANSLRARPHINLRLKPPLLAQAVMGWHVVSSALEGSLPAMFGTERTSATVELKLQVQLGRNGPAIRHDLTARIEARQPRTSVQMDTETANWFRCAVASIKRLDHLLVSQLGEKGTVRQGDNKGN